MLKIVYALLIVVALTSNTFKLCEAQSDIYIDFDLKESCDSSIYVEWNDFYWEFNGELILPSDSVKNVRNNYPNVDTLVFYNNNSDYSPFTILTRLNPEKDYILTSAMWYKDFNIFEKTIWDSDIYKMYDFSNDSRNSDSIFHSTLYPEKVKIKMSKLVKHDSIIVFYGQAMDYPYLTGQLLTKSNSGWMLPDTDFLESRNYSIIIAKLKPRARTYMKSEKNTITVKQNEIIILYKTRIRLFEGDKCNIMYDYRANSLKSIVFKKQKHPWHTQ